MRIFVLLLALLLLAAPAGSLCAEACPDVAAETCACDALLTRAAVAVAAPRSHTLFVPAREAAIPAAPEGTQIFRPPDRRLA